MNERPTVPPGWPPQVRPPGTPEWDRTATQWLLDLCPPDYRGYPVLGRHPVVLAWLAGHHVAGSGQAMAAAVAAARSDLRDALDARTTEQVLRVLEAEQARLLATARAVSLVEQALRGRRFIPRL